MSKALALSRIFLRQKLYYIFISIAVILAISTIIGGIIASSISTSYMFIRISKEVPVHIVVTLDLSPAGTSVTDTDMVWEFLHNATIFAEKLANSPRISKVYTTIYMFLTTEFYKVYLIDRALGERKVEFGVTYTVISSLSSSDRISIVDGKIDGIGIGLRDLDSSIGHEVSIILVKDGKEITIYNNTLSFIFEQVNPLANISSSFFSSGPIVNIPEEKGIYVNVDGLREIINGSTPYLKTIMFTIVYDITVEKTAIPPQPEAISSVLNDIMYNEIVPIGKEVFSDRLFSIERTGFGPVVVTTGSSVRVDDFMLSMDLSSPLANIIGMLSFITSSQSVSVITGLALPILVSSWYLLTITTGLLAERMRRYIALAITRGVSGRQLRRVFLIVSMVVAIVAGLLALPLSYGLGYMMIGWIVGEPSKLYTPDLVFNYTTIAIAVIVSAILAFIALRRVSKYFRESTDLSILTRLFVPPIREPWNLGTGMKVLLLLSIFKYGLWLTGMTMFDLMNMATRTGNIVLVILVGILFPIDWFMSILAPYIITYVLVMSITHSEKALNFLAKHVTRLVSRDLSYSVANFILKGSTRLYRVSFVIALIIAVTTTYIGMSSSLGAWIGSFVEKIQEIGSSTGAPIFLLSALFEGQIASYRMTAYISIFLAVLGSIIITLVLLTDMDKELAVLRARGAGLRDLGRFVYGVVFTVLIMSISVGLLSGFIWLRGSLSSVSSGIGIGFLSENIPKPAMVFTLNDLLYLCIIFGILFLSPLVIIMFSQRYPVAEKLRSLV
ncbi:MAG: hypothetical protein J7K21_07560 [Desulfurococcales archaeon]|nr:hypothetical protein [Desulfurococcales archaeon]